MAPTTKADDPPWSDRIVLMLGTDPDMRGGIAAVVCAIRDEGFFEWARVQYVATHVDGTSIRKVWRLAGALLASVTRLSSGRVALVHAHVSYGGSFWRKAILLWIARKFGAPTLFHLHSGEFDAFATHGRGGSFRRWCIRQSLESSSTVVVLSERWATWVRGFAPRSHIKILPNPVRIPTQSTSATRGDPAGTGRVLYLGLICDAKGSFDLLHAWQRFRVRAPGWRLIVGGNGEVERFLAMAEQLGIRQDIDYLGWTTGDAKAEALWRSDVFVLPSYAEGMPVSILEAMAHGAAVIATPVGGVQDMMVNERHGLLVAPGDVEALAASMLRLANNPLLRRRLAEHAHARVLENYASARVVDRLKGIYRVTIAAPP